MEERLLVLAISAQAWPRARIRKKEAERGGIENESIGVQQAKRMRARQVLKVDYFHLNSSIM